MPTRNSARTFLLLRFVLCGLLGLLAGQAQAGASALWGTVIANGPSEYFSSAQAACQRQHDSWAPDARGPVTAEIADSWRMAACDWITHMDGGPWSVFPTWVIQECVDKSSGTWQPAAGYRLIPPGLCVPDGDPLVSRPVCEANKGALPNPTVADPVIIATGSLHDAATDYADADGRLRIARTYRSRHGDNTYYLPGFGGGDLWRFNFQWEWLTNPGFFIVNGVFGIAAPDGSDYSFMLHTNGAVTALDAASNELTVQYLGAAPVNYNSVLQNGGSFLVTTAAGDQIKMVLFKRAPGTSYQRGQPERITYRGGYAWQFSYGSKGELQRVDDSLGRAFTLTWFASENADYSGISYPRAISTITLPDGTMLNYSYDSYTGSLTDSQRYARLKNMTRRNGGNVVDSASYRYENTGMPFLLTAVVDNAGISRASWQYDSVGRVTSAQHDQGVDATSFAYATSGNTVTRTVTNPLGKQTVYSFAVSYGEAMLTSVTGNPTTSCVGTTAAIVYDSNNRKTSVTDEAGNITKYTYDAAGNQATVTEAFGTPLQRVTTTTWNAAFTVPTRIVQPGLTTDLSYDTAGRLTSVQKTDTTSHTTPYATNGRTRTWTYSYNTQGLLSQVDGPLTGLQDAVLLSYDSKGYLQGTANGLWHQWLIAARDSAGRPTSVVDPNGVLTTLTYDGAGRLASQAINGKTTTWTYDAVGNVTQVKLMPAGTYIQYSYDSARRLYELRDQSGNRIRYTLDAAGNRTAEQVYDPANQLRRSQTRVYDELSRLRRIQDPNGQETLLGYDLLNNVNSRTRMGNITTLSEFDKLNRLFKVTDASQGITRYEYDALDRLTTVTDPRGVITRYTVDGFGNVIQIASPDSGTTVQTFDAADNLLTRRDAKSQLTSYSYDGIGRRTGEVRADGATYTYGYDQGLYGIGRLTSEAGPAGNTTWQYNALGLVTTKIQTVAWRALTTRYAYDASGRMTQQTLPSGKVVDFAWTGDRITSIGVNGAWVAAGIGYQPFGPASQWLFANGQSVARQFDQSGRMTSYGLEAIGYDTGDRIASTGGGATAKTYGYDALDRLTSFTTSGFNITYGYDANGNRKQQNWTGGGAVTTTMDTASNRIATLVDSTGTRTYNHDANGSLVSDGGHSYSYDSGGRLSGVDGSFYGYNGLGQRLFKSATGAATLFTYDEGWRLTGEYGLDGVALQETVWLGDIPLIVLKGASRYYVESDHLNTPRRISNDANASVWTWDVITFGGSVPNDDPGSTGNHFTYNLRFPGQYYDAESGLFQNGFRDYSPKLGRYVESDPIGLAGGLNTYGYVGGDPVGWVDPLGLNAIAGAEVGFSLGGPLGGLLGAGIGYFATGQLIKLMNNEADDGASGDNGQCPSVPEDYTGNNDNGNGKTDLPGGAKARDDLFDKLSGGVSATDGAGNRIAPNGVRTRTGRDGRVRLDIPAPSSGARGPETIHFNN